jgi:UDP-N-acetylglucosamine 2-epimerase (non-hydrolysing)
LHRPANVDRTESLRPILTPIRELAERMAVVFPVHPRTRAVLDPVLAEDGAPPGLRLVEPLGYLDFLRLTCDARVVLTDSGGIQEETTVLRVPCVTLRDNTERPITLSQGTNRLAGTTTTGIREALAAALCAPPGDAPPPPLWDGRAGERIADILAGGGRP